jgi:hypothetical protein
MECYGGEGRLTYLQCWAGYCVRAGQEYRVNVWSCTVGRILCEGRARVQG